jgi:deoxycytidylate deaminase
MKIEYPYLPDNKEIRFTTLDNPFMQRAKLARYHLSGDRLYPIGACLVKNNSEIACAGNGFNKGRGARIICKRYVHDAPTGHGYDLCAVHDPPGHAERTVINVARTLGRDTRGADIYLYGHWWCCKDCWDVMIDAGIRNVYIFEGAKEEFTREKVYGEVLGIKIKTVYIASALTNIPQQDRKDFLSFLEAAGSVCESFGIDAYLPHKNTDPEVAKDLTAEEIYKIGLDNASSRDVTIAEVTYPSLGAGGEIVIAEKNNKHVVLMSKKGAKVSRFVRGNPAAIYHIEYDSPEEALDHLGRVLVQIEPKS